MATVITLKFQGWCAGGHEAPAGTQARYDKTMKPSIRACEQCDATLRRGGGGNVVSLDAYRAAGGSQGPLKDVRVRVVGITWAKPDKSWVVAKCEYAGNRSDKPDVWPASGAFGVVGPLGEVGVGEVMSVNGAWEQSKYGWQIKATTAVAVIDGDAGFEAFLCRLPEVGPKRAQDIMHTFGGREGADAVLSKGDVDALTRINGITPERAHVIIEAYVKQTGIRESYTFLVEKGCDPHVIRKALDEWGQDAARVVEEDPYRLMDLPRVGFRIADSIALRGFGLAKLDPRRASAAVKLILEEQESEGHTWTHLSEIVGDVTNLTDNSEMVL